MCTVLLAPGDNPIAVDKYISININIVLIDERSGTRFVHYTPVKKHTE